MELKHKHRNMLQAVLAAGLIVLGLGMGEKAQALPPNPNTMVVAVTPSASSAYWGVLISSPLTSGTTGYDFGQVDLAATTISTVAITVTSTGTVAEYFSMAVSNSQPDNWSAISAAPTGYDTFLMLGHFVTHLAGQPASGTFSVLNDTMTATVPTTAASRYGQTSITTPGTPLDLYLMLTMPATVKTNAGQWMTLTVNGQGS
jgi:hypothetical protein